MGGRLLRRRSRCSGMAYLTCRFIRCLKAEEARPRPVGPRDLLGDRRERGMRTPAIFEAILGHGHDIGLIPPFPHQPCPRPKSRARIGPYTAGLGELLGQPPKPPTSGVGQVAMGIFLDAVGDAPNQEIAAEATWWRRLMPTPPRLPKRCQIHLLDLGDLRCQPGHSIRPARRNGSSPPRPSSGRPRSSASGVRSAPLGRCAAAIRSLSGVAQMDAPLSRRSSLSTVSILVGRFRLVVLGWFGLRRLVAMLASLGPAPRPSRRCHQPKPGLRLGGPGMWGEEARRTSPHVRQ